MHKCGDRTRDRTNQPRRKKNVRVESFSVSCCFGDNGAKKGLFYFHKQNGVSIMLKWCSTGMICTLERRTCPTHGAVSHDGASFQV